MKRLETNNDSKDMVTHDTSGQMMSRVLTALAEAMLITAKTNNAREINCPQ